jgi:hypothetical protein
MDPFDEVREFSADEIPAAASFIRNLPANTRVYVDAWDDGDWEFAFFDDQRFAAGSLGLLRPGQRFRVRAAHEGDLSSPTPAGRWKPSSDQHGPNPHVLLVPPRTHERRRWHGIRRFFEHLLR